jgi:V/A-type H+/Na+-transporting ATPase subunit D
MAQLRLTKNELRNQQTKLNQLLRYLPTLQLKKALLQSQVAETKQEFYRLEEELKEKQSSLEEHAALLTEWLPLDLMEFVKIKELKKHYENIAGSEVPVFDDAIFLDLNYDLFDTPIWLEGMIYGLRGLSLVRGKMIITEERRQIIEQELRQVSIRVNLFEKILIPRCEANLKKIKVFLGDQLLNSIAQAKVAKEKIEKALASGGRHAH